MPIDARIPLMVTPVKSELDRQQSLADLAARQQNTEIQGQQWQQQQAAQQQAGHREQVAMTAKLLEGVTDEASYQRAKQAAHAYGIDIGDAPDNFDPEWVDVHHMIATTLLKPDGEAKLTNTAQELREAGYRPGTPEFVQAMRQRIALADSKVVSTTDGGMAGMLGYGGQYQPFILPNPGSAPAGSPVGGGVQEGATATNPQTGEKLIYRGGQWQPMGGAASNGGGNFPPGQ